MTSQNRPEGLLRTRVKLCGLTRPQDVDTAVQAGADAIGLVFHPSSKRSVNLAEAVALRQRVPAFVSVVTLFVNASPDDVRAVLDAVQPDMLQFHGDETPEYCASFDHRFVKAFRVGMPGLDTAPGVLAACRSYAGASGWLFDSYSQGYGGSGTSFDPSLLDAVRRASDARPLILAGGLNSHTVAAAIRAIQPFAVDVSSGIEDAPGEKSPEKILSFMQAVRGA